MKKLLAILLAAIMLLSATACNKQATDQSTSQSADQSSDISSEQLTDEPEEKEEDEPHKTITFETDNEYMEITSIDTSECTWEDGQYSGWISYVITTKQKYIDEYFDDYRGRQIYFGFYTEDGELVGDSIDRSNLIYDREYTRENRAYVSISSKHNISEVKVLKFVCEA